MQLQTNRKQCNIMKAQDKITYTKRATAVEILRINACIKIRLTF